jgi:hypothetical protein
VRQIAPGALPAISHQIICFVHNTLVDDIRHIDATAPTRVGPCEVKVTIEILAYKAIPGVGAHYLRHPRTTEWTLTRQHVPVVVAAAEPNPLELKVASPRYREHSARCSSIVASGLRQMNLSSIHE